jgi:hypothetical protein
MTHKDEFSELINDLTTEALDLAKVEVKTEALFKEIGAPDQYIDKIRDYSAEVQRQSYLAGFRDGILLMAGNY